MDAHDLVTDIIALARSQGRTLTTAESCTGGLIAGAMTRVSGASDVFHEGYVTYSNEAKSRLLGVPESVLAEHGAVSLKTAHCMAEGALKSAGADLALSVTGIAGPTGGSEEKPVGTVCFGLAFRSPDGEVKSLANLHHFEDMGRDFIREQSVMYALHWVLEHLRAEEA
ncbi:nicotinamide-nucleotide amidohydrolase family protein [Asticcacaulis sp. BYS171W]|uniref:Nicotinamide-nucleotide amidohydrolase family protein n=1 Tax=Asticcacaulis aquaticus TaxID=2984212 RepID=A0ABT5HQU6_9CAUL|nr:nicotinamide-nucleotide amidohydrolase family protein [Asticcacaulis aquaticus]MDC7681816.1 nicotinamide-nucleotide amidohydrolase family protein [Asticcacaulis aquaticus]